MFSQQKVAVLRDTHGSAIRIGEECRIAEDLCVEISEGGRLFIGAGVTIRRGTTIQVFEDAQVVIGDGVCIGENCFLAAMVGIHLAAHSGLAQMCDLHDHNHVRGEDPERSMEELGFPTSRRRGSADLGYVAAPIVVEDHAHVSNKVTLTAGVRIGQNSVIGANSVVTASVPPNRVMVGAPARVSRTFDSPLRPSCSPRQMLRVDCFGHSLMEHYEARNLRMRTQSALPEVGSTVTVEDWGHGGYTEALRLSLQAEYPYLDLGWHNHARGGATSRDVRRTVEETLRKTSDPLDVVFLGAAVNDVWRRFQGRTAEAVEADEFRENYRAVLRELRERARHIVCVGDTPLGWDAEVDVTEMNREIRVYNTIAEEEAAAAGAHFVDVYGAFAAASNQLQWEPGEGPSARSLWSDGVHLSPLGDALVARVVGARLSETGAVSSCTTYARIPARDALARYQGVIPEMAE